MLNVWPHSKSHPKSSKSSPPSATKSPLASSAAPISPSSKNSSALQISPSPPCSTSASPRTVSLPLRWASRCPARVSSNG
jgi:hypothetical protein